MKKWIKRILYFFGGLLAFLIIIILLLHTSWAKNIVREKLQAYISGKTKTEFTIGRINYRIPDWIEMDNVFMRDMNKDTLLVGAKMRMDIDMLQIIRGRYEISKIEFDSTYINLTKRENDSVFNYQFIADAFTSKTTSPEKKDNSPLDIALKEIILKHTRFNNLDYNTGVLTRLLSVEFDMKVDSFDLKRLHFDVNRLYADSVFLTIQTLKENNDTFEVQGKVKNPIPIIRADSITIKNSMVFVEDKLSGLLSSNKIGSLTAVKISNAKKANVFEGKSLSLSNSDIVFQHNPDYVPKYNRVDTVQIAGDLVFIVDDIDLHNNNVKYDNIAKPARLNGIDFFHLGVSKLELVATKNRFSDGSIQSSVDHFSFEDKSGFRLDTLKGVLDIDSGSINVKDFVLRTPNSYINAQAMIYPSSFTSSYLADQSKRNTIILAKTVIGRKDLQLLSNDITGKFKEQLDQLEGFVIDTKTEGNMRELFISELKVNSLTRNTLNLDLSGVVRNVTDKNNITYNIVIKNLTASERILSPFLGKQKQNIDLPSVINLRGTVVGNMKQVNTNLVTNSEYGYAVVKAKLTGFQKPESMIYDVSVTANDMETGRWVHKDSLLGKMTGSFTAKGNGYNIKRSNIKATANIASIRYKKNVIDNIQLNASLAKGFLETVASVKDELIDININGNGNIGSQYPTADATVNVHHADLFGLGLSKDTLNVAVMTRLKIDNSTPKGLDAFIRIDSAVIVKDHRKIMIDSAVATGKVRNDSTFIVVTSPFVDADIKSTVYYNEIIPLVTEVSNRFIFADSIHDAAKTVRPGVIQTNIVVKPSDVYSSFITNLYLDDAATLQGKITNNKDSSVDMVLHIPGLVADGNLRIGNMEGNIKGKGDSLNLTLITDTVKMGRVLLYDASVKGGFSKKNLAVQVSTNDNMKKEQFALSATVNKDHSNVYNIKLGNDLKLNYDNWNVSDQNLTRVSKSGFNIKDLSISNKNQKISLNSEDASFDAPVVADIENLQLSSFTTLYDKEAFKLDGILTAHVTASDFDHVLPTMDGTIKVDSIVYQEMSVGSLSLKAQSSNYDVSLTGKLEGNGNNVNIDGSYNARNIDAMLRMNPVTMSSIQAFSQGNLSNSSGNVYGFVNLTGLANDPEWRGELKFDSVKTTAAKFGTQLVVVNQKLTFDYPTISFDYFTVSDKLGNKLTIDGELNENKKKHFLADLSIVTKDFHLLDNSASDNANLYGTAIVDIDASVTGDIIAPSIEGNLFIKKGTDVTFIKQNVAPSAKARNAVMEFVNMDTISNLLTTKTLQEVLAEQSYWNAAGDLSYDLDIETDPEAKFNIIIDPITRDELQVKGEATLNASVMPNGSLALVGTYNLSGGTYQFNYQFVKRKFELLEGSTLTLNGDPNRAYADITAAFDIEASAYDLLGNEIAGASNSQINTYKRKVPFRVLLYIKGEILNPKLGFDIVMKENVAGVNYELATAIDNKLQQIRGDQTSMNKQVFALLVMKRFIGEQSNDFFGGNNAVSSVILANESVSGFLNDAMNRLAADLIKGVDVDIDLTNVDQGALGNRTDLNVSLTKSLNDRLSVSVGKNFALAGQSATTSNTSDKSSSNVQAMPDITVAYKLSKDGKYMLRVYRRNEYEAILDGYFIETGIAFLFTIEYDTLRELLKKKPKK